MAVNGGAGNAISFSEIRDFYAGSNPVSLSDYNRGGDKVPQSFAGSETITSGTASETVDDFTVTQTPEQFHRHYGRQRYRATSVCKCTGKQHFSRNCDDFELHSPAIRCTAFS